MMFFLTLGWILAHSLTLVEMNEARLVYRGADFSSLLQVESSGHTFKNSQNVTEPLELILAKSGATTSRQRLWVNPVDLVYDLSYNLKLAKRAQAAGLDIYLDLHLSDTWADPGKQTVPAGWANSLNSIDQLCSTLQNYTQQISNEFHLSGIYPSIISIGNEIDQGLLWDLGQITHHPENLAKLLHSASKGIRSSELGTRTKIMVHTSQAWNKEKQLWFFKSILSFGTFTLSDFDMIGLSFYPFYGPGATMIALQESLTALESAYPDQLLVIAETNWPVSCPSPLSPLPPDSQDLPFSPDGQIQWTKRISDVLSSLKNGAGYFYWEGAWLNHANLGSSCSDNLLFEPDGSARSSVNMFSMT